MIEPKELRIGNYVENGGNYYVTDFLTIRMAHNYNPIPLTPELLEKCGFLLAEDYGDMQCFEMPDQKSGYGVERDHDDWAFYKFTSGSATTLIWNEEYFMYLHQLQNLWYALTGTDLVVNL